MNVEKILQNARRAKLPEFCVKALEELCSKITEGKKEAFFESCVEKCKDHTLEDEEILQEFPAQKDADLFRMLIIVALIDYGEKLYREKNIPLEIFEENLLDAPIWLEYHMDNYAHPGFQWRIVSWCRTLWEGNVLKFGRLQLETAGTYKEKYNSIERGG